MEKIVLGLSGGVDSAVAASLLKAQGWDVHCLWLDIGLGGGEDAEALAARLGLPFAKANIAQALEKEVCGPFAADYLAGRTPLPCARCNPAVKFPALLAEADRIGAKYVATGHYARVEHLPDGTAQLFRADCRERDQSYMLHRLTQEQLSMLLLPLQGMEKSQVRAIAQEAGLASAQAPDSQEICWIPDNDYASYIEKHFGRCQPGEFISPDGAVCGTHQGLLHYTVGQRKRLGIALGYPVFIREIDPASNRIYLARTGEEYFPGITLEQVVVQPNPWLSPEEGSSAQLSVKIRSRAGDAPALVTMTGPDTAVVRFAEPQRAPAPGQSCVFYQGDQVLGGGYIHQQLTV